MKTNKLSELLKGTPSLLLMLGAGFVMASSSNLQAALGMGAAVLISMLLASLVLTALCKFIPAYAQLPAYLLIITGFVSIIGMLMQAWLPDVANMLGIHLATIAVSAVIYRKGEESAEGNIFPINTALVTGVYLTVIMLVSALIREFIGSASIWGQPIEFMANYKISAIAGAFGGYLVLAIVTAIINKLTSARNTEMILGILLASIFSENIALVESLGAGAVLENHRSTKRSLLLGLGTTVVMLISTAITWALNSYVLKNVAYLQTLVFVFVVLVVVELMYIAAKKLFNCCKYDFVMFTINGAVLGLCVQSAELTFVSAIITAIAVGIGFMLTTTVYAKLKDTLVYQDAIPEAFRGLPISLLTAGIMVLAMLALQFSL